MVGEQEGRSNTDNVEAIVIQVKEDFVEARPARCRGWVPRVVAASFIESGFKTKAEYRSS